MAVIAAQGHVNRKAGSSPLSLEPQELYLRDLVSRDAVEMTCSARRLGLLLPSALHHQDKVDRLPGDPVGSARLGYRSHAFESDEFDEIVAVVDRGFVAASGEGVAAGGIADQGGVAAASGALIVRVSASTASTL